jgi:hypothetical protein
MTGDEPTAAAALERACSLMNEAMYTVALQRRRLTTAEPEDQEFVMRKWADWQFFIMALWRLRRNAMIATRLASTRTAAHRAISEFDRDIPGLKRLRDVGEHIDDYAIDAAGRHVKSITRRQLQVGSWTDTTLSWAIGVGDTGTEINLNAETAVEAAERLLVAIRALRDANTGSHLPR